MFHDLPEKIEKALQTGNAEITEWAEQGEQEEVYNDRLSAYEDIEWGDPFYDERIEPHETEEILRKYPKVKYNNNNGERRNPYHDPYGGNGFNNTDIPIERL